MQRKTITTHTPSIVKTNALTSQLGEFLKGLFFIPYSPKSKPTSSVRVALAELCLD
jgi:hypothetical protein